MPVELRYSGTLYIPDISYDVIGCDVLQYVKAKTPSDDVVYNRLGIPPERRGHGLNAIPDPPKGGEPKCAMSTLIHLALVGSPRKCLLGYEIVGILMGHFKYFRTTTNDWKVSTIMHSCQNPFIEHM